MISCVHLFMEGPDDKKFIESLARSVGLSHLQIEEIHGGLSTI